ncbi:ribokinase [Pleomorphomonas sp. JP5]|uniref:ribokinase n=1 Tax=Pleomorphomonas sp. JP5 TaxID=2942998 RepID=UPI002044771F|nr:ribokinase [Pleomorphomonas sp. JP5]MCM5559406.1 ribokinase [Pleomorphomonas sp. JP5]
MSVIVIGSVNVDIVTYADRAPRPGESLTGHRYSMVLGGKGANQSVAVARLGASVRFLGRVGADSFGGFIRSRLTDLGVDPGNLAVDASLPTGIAVIGIDGQGENAITVVPGANTGLAVEQVEAAAPLFSSVKVLLAQLEHPFPATLKAVELARRAGALAILDPAPVPMSPLGGDTIRLFDALTPNEIETEALTGIAPVDVEAAAAAARRLRETGLPLALVKMGARGVYVDSADFRGHVPPFAVKAIDTVAAGDCFAAGLAVALAEGMAVESAVRFAAAAGALACTKEGSSEAAPTRGEVEGLLAKNNRAS